MPPAPLDCLFHPEAIVLVSASGGQDPLGKPLARDRSRLLGRNLATSGFRGPLWAVRPARAGRRGTGTASFCGLPCVTDLASLPVRPDLAILATPPAQTPAWLDQLGALGARAAILTSPGFGEGGDPGGLDRRAEILAVARRHGLRLLGPNCLGLMVPGSGLNASLGPRLPRSGRLAFVAQSGTLVATVLDWALARGIGFSHLVSLGDMVDLDFGDLLDHLALDGGVSAILLFIESLGPARKFLSAARAAARLKPVILVKAGHTAAGARAVLSHTGALAGSDAVQDAAFRRAGLLRVHSLEELFDAVTTLALTRPPRGGPPGHPHQQRWRRRPGDGCPARQRGAAGGAERRHPGGPGRGPPERLVPVQSRRPAGGRGWPALCPRPGHPARRAGGGRDPGPAQPQRRHPPDGLRPGLDSRLGGGQRQVA